VIILAWFGVVLIPLLIYLALAANSHVSSPTPAAATRRRVVLGISYVLWILALMILAVLGGREANDVGNGPLGTDDAIVGGLLLLIAAALPLALWPLAVRITTPRRPADEPR
jgi:hypothetical protein